MSNVARVAGQAANTLTKPLEVEEVFSTYLYTGNGSTQTITNGIDLAGEGGLVWIKKRITDAVGNVGHRLVDSNRNLNSPLDTSSTGTSFAGYPNAFTSSGFTLDTNRHEVNFSGTTYASWTFRKAPKFFDIVTYTGTGSAQNISHNLGSVPACIITKRTDASENWLTYHRGLDATAPEDKYVMLNKTNAVQDASTIWNDTAPTGTEFTVGSANTNTSGGSYVAYLFAHNNNDGGFGPDGDADIIKCGSYTGNGSTSSGPHIDLGFEPQWILVKTATQSGNWSISDTMRGFHHGNQINLLYPHLSNAEAVVSTTPSQAAPTSNGFQVQSSGTNFNTSGQTYIYIAIRRPTAVPTSATEVFDVQTSTSANFVHTTGFDVDLAITGSQDGWARNAGVVDRLRGDGKSLETSNTDAESAGNAGVHEFDRSREYLNSSTSGDQVAWAWKRASKYFDVVAYKGNSTAGRTVSHNLGVAPEMMWVRPRSFADHWNVYHTANGNTKYMRLNTTDTPFTNTNIWNSTTPDASSFTLGSDFGVNGSGYPYIAYLFASLAGISKVGSYTGNGSTLNIDCGFTSGARFVLIKSVGTSGSWYVLDTERGIVAGNDPVLSLNTTDVEEAFDDLIDPYSAGFTLNGVGMVNANTVDYIFYAIA